MVYKGHYRSTKSDDRKLNIFILDEDPEQAAKMHCDKHCLKMILETAQLLCTAVRLSGREYGYEITHRNHPCAKWTRASRGNFAWLRRLGQELCWEYSYRYGNAHKAEDIISRAPIDWMPEGDRTPFVQCMPEEYKVYGDAVQSYRNYYIGAKKHLLIYTNRLPPDWLADIATYKSP
jgi:hypothetical protein